MSLLIILVITPKVYYRQRACDSHPWRRLPPGESAAYTWEEPMKPKKLSVRVGVGEWIEHRYKKQNRNNASGREKTWIPLFSYHFIQNEEMGHFGSIKTVKLEEIGYTDRLPCPSICDMRQVSLNERVENPLHCHVDTEGATRVLIISDEATDTDTDGKTSVLRHLSNIRKEILDEEKRWAKIEIINRMLASMARNMNPSRSHDVTKCGLDDSICSTPLYSLAENVDANGSENADASDDESVGCQLNAVTDAASIEAELQNIVDYDEGLFITRRNQLLVEVCDAYLLCT